MRSATTMAAIAGAASSSSLRRWAVLVAPPLAGGAISALAVPPWGFWPLGWLGAAVLAWRLRGLSWDARAAVGMAFGVGLFVPGLWWMGEFHAVGAALAVLVEAAFFAAAAAAVPADRGQALALPAAVVVAELARGLLPFGGVPLAGLGLGQAGGALAGAARLGGELLLAGMVVAVGVGLAGMATRRWAQAGVALVVVLVVAVAGWWAPDGGGGPTIRTALVQGGGPRGFRATETDPAEVLDRHLAASEALRPPLDLVLWPEDVVDVEGPTRRTPEGAQLAAVARRHRTTLVAGVVEGAGDDHFKNAALAWSAEGELIGRYDKTKRVPFGEYVPLRDLVEDVVDLSAIPRDALAGSGPGLLRTPPADAGVLISYEVFFARRGRAAVRAGGDALLVPTNAASFSTTQMPAQELAAARLRAIEAGRDLVQASPTGYSAYVDNRGRVRVRTELGRRAVVQRPVTLRTGRTLYVTVGDWPVLGASALALVGAWRSAGVPVSRRTRRAGTPAGRRDGPART